MRSLKTTTLLTATLIMASAQTLHATPIYDTFGSLDTEFGGDGIPNTAVAIGTQAFDGVLITAALSASQRFGAPTVTNDGAGNFEAAAGATFDTPGDPTSRRSLWNFNFYMEVVGTDAAIEDYQFDLYYDFSTGEDTTRSNLGRIDISGGAVGTGITKVENSWNLDFDFLAASVPFVTPPAGSYDPYALGEYNFAIVVTDPVSEFPIEIVAIDVQVVPEPTSLALLGLGGLMLNRRRRRH